MIQQIMFSKVTYNICGTKLPNFLSWFVESYDNIGSSIPHSPVSDLSRKKQKWVVTLKELSIQTYPFLFTYLKLCSADLQHSIAMRVKGLTKTTNVYSLVCIPKRFRA